MCMCFFDVKVPENDLKKIETCRSVNESYIKMCVYNNAAFVGIIYLIIHKHMDMDNIVMNATLATKFNVYFVKYCIF